MIQPFIRYYQTHKVRIHRLLAEGGWIAAGQVASVIGALVLVRVLTGYLDPAQYGQLALGLTVAGLVNQVVMGGLINGVSRFYSIAAEKQDLGAYLLATRYLMAYATAVIVAVAFVLVATLYWLGYPQWIGLALAALVFSVLSSYNSVIGGIQNAARQRAVVAVHGGLDAWLKIILAVGAVLWLGAASTAVVIGYACSSLLITISQLYFLHRTIPAQSVSTPERQRWMPQIWAYSLPFSTWGIFTWMQLASDRWALQTFASTSDVGQYAVLFQLGYTPIALITGMAVSFFGPILYQRSGDATNLVRNANVHRLGWRLSQIAVTVTMLSFALTCALHEQLFSILVASNFHKKSYLLPWVVLAGGLFASAQMLALKLMSAMNPSTMTTAKITTALICIPLNLFGAAYAGLQGVVAALVIFSVIYYVWMAMLAKRMAVTACIMT